jgi:hypothetical protein
VSLQAEPPQEVYPGALVELLGISIAVQVENVVLEPLEVVPSSLADAAGPSVCLAYDHPVGALWAAGLLMDLQLALTFEALVAEAAFRCIPGYGSRRVLEYGCEHGAVLEVLGGVALLYTQYFRLDLGDVLMGDGYTVGKECGEAVNGNLILGGEQDLLAICG